MMKKIFTFGAVCALLLTACGKVTGAVQTTGGSTAGGSVQIPGKIQVENTDSQVITVTSRETVKVVPDMAEIVIAVTTQDSDAAACQNMNNEKLNQLIETLKGLGVADHSIQTSGYDLNPKYDWNKNGEIVGYESTTQVTVSDLPLEQVGEIMSKSVESGVNQIQSVSFLASKYDESYQMALKQAVAQAQEKAQALADASGCTLGRAVKITEFSANDSARYLTMGARNSMKEEMASDMAVMPGEIEIEASISVDYAIQ